LPVKARLIYAFFMLMKRRRAAPRNSKNPRPLLGGRWENYCHDGHKVASYGNGNGIVKVKLMPKHLGLFRFGLHLPFSTEGRESLGSAL